MNLELPAEAVEFGAAAEKAFLALGGVDLARHAEADPGLRAGLVAGALDGLGLADLDPRADLDTAVAAAELCRAAGRSALPYPVVGVLLGRGLPLALVPPPRGRDCVRVDHGDLFERWKVVDPAGRAHLAGPGSGGRLGSRLGPFVVDLDVAAPADPPEPGATALHLSLTAWRILGAVERALELAVDHVRTREQFGQPLAAFQAVQFQLADAAVAVDGLRELGRFTLWRLWADPESSHVDALALRLHALDVARSVLRTSQQLHGAAGVCDEYDVSILCRHLQPVLRLPYGSQRAARELVDAVAASGFDGLFPHGSSHGSPPAGSRS